MMFSVPCWDSRKMLPPCGFHGCVSDAKNNKISFYQSYPFHLLHDHSFYMVSTPKFMFIIYCIFSVSSMIHSFSSQVHFMSSIFTTSFPRFFPSFPSPDAPWCWYFCIQKNISTWPSFCKDSFIFQPHFLPIWDWSPG